MAFLTRKQVEALGLLANIGENFNDWANLMNEKYLVNWLEQHLKPGSYTTEKRDRMSGLNFISFQREIFQEYAQLMCSCQLCCCCYPLHAKMKEVYC